MGIIAGASAKVRPLTMAEYRAYTVGDDGHFIGFEAFVCADDSKAIAQAKRLIDGRDVELWNGPRFVIKLESDPNSSFRPARRFVF
jgi:hypothetical protein